MRLLCWNINALVPTLRNITLKHGSLLGFFEHHQADVICFQETKILPDKLSQELACIKGYQSFWAISRDKRGYSGVVTYVLDSWSPIQAEADSLGSGDSDIDKEGRVIISDHGAFVLLNVYAPNAGGTKEGRPRADFKLQFLHALKDRVDNLLAAGRQVILMGDLNVAASELDVHGGCDYASMYSPAEKSVMQALLAELIDSWRLQHPDTRDTFTVWDERTNARAFNKGVRLDYALLSKGLVPSLVSCEIISTPPKWSDHAALLLTLQPLTPPPPHPPCALSSSRLFPAQPSIASLFARKRSAAGTSSSSAVDEPAPPNKKLRPGKEDPGHPVLHDRPGAASAVPSLRVAEDAPPQPSLPGSQAAAARPSHPAMSLHAGAEGASSARDSNPVPSVTAECSRARPSVSSGEPQPMQKQAAGSVHPQPVAFRTGRTSSARSQTPTKGPVLQQHERKPSQKSIRLFFDSSRTAKE